MKFSLYAHSQESSQEHSSQLCEKLAWRGLVVVGWRLTSAEDCLWGGASTTHTTAYTYNQWHRRANRCGIGHFTFFKKKNPTLHLVVMLRGTDRLPSHRRQREETALVLSLVGGWTLFHTHLFSTKADFSFCLFFWSSKATKISYTSLRSLCAGNVTHVLWSSLTLRVLLVHPYNDF